MSNLKINDGEYIVAEKIVSSYLEQLGGQAQKLSAIIDRLLAQSLKDQAITAQLNDLKSKLATVSSSIGTARSSLNGKAKAFIQSVDEIDQFIY